MWGNRMSDPTPRAGLPLVLLAGDHPDDTNWLRNLLEPAGYAVLREPSGRYALERARGTEPDVIIVDAELPDMAGVELCRLLRADPRVSSSTPLLLAFREHASRDQRTAALRAGAWECIAPPHEADEILLKIGAYVRAKLDADRARAEGLLDPLTGLYNRQGLARCACAAATRPSLTSGMLQLSPWICWCALPPPCAPGGPKGPTGSGASTTAPPPPPPRSRTADPFHRSRARPPRRPLRSPADSTSSSDTPRPRALR